MKKLDFIQALRGMAAMLVVFYHFRTYLNFSFYNLGSFLFDSGSIGVDLFFMISGFIMVYTTTNKETGTFAGLRFILKRLIRIVPLYWICTFLFMLVAHGFDWFVHGSHWAWVSKGLFFIPMDLLGNGPFYGYAPLFTGWTLNYEMLFYLILGISIFFNRSRWLVFFGIFSLLLIIVPFANHSFTLNAYIAPDFDIRILNFLTNPILFDFLIGVAAGFLFISGLTIKNNAVIIPFLLLSVVFFIVQYFTGYRGGHGITQYGISCALILFSSLLFFKENRLAIPGWMIFLGNISYSIYITHLIILIGFENLVTYMNWNGVVQDPLFFIPLIALVILFSYLTSTLIEKKFSKFLNRIILNDKE